MNPNIIETINITRQAAWLPWAVQYFFLIGISVTAVFLTLPAFLGGNAKYEKIGRLALLTAVSCAIAAMIALVADLHQPGRFWHFYTHFTSWSWMSRGAFLLPFFLVLVVIYAWLVYRADLGRLARQPGTMLAPLYKALALGDKPERWMVRPVAFLTLLSACSIALYTGMEVMVVKARPLWHTPFLPWMYLFTGLVGATGVCLLLNRVIGGNDRGVERGLNRFLLIALGLLMVNGVLWLASGLSGVSAPAHRALLSMSGNVQWLTVAVWAGLSAIVLFVIAWLKPEGTGVITGLIAVHSAWMFRWTVFINGQMLPKMGSGLYPYHFPVGPEGLLGIIGTFGLWVLIIAALTAFLPWDGRVEASGAASH
ncbi:MAG TPA: tetrathionate reductase [Betaproteobacteria bacterium]|nr:tetrathionate reductase [Betaproteobacteria bacterium]